jgi:hypothetical protein
MEECTYFWGVNTSWGINTVESKDLCIRKIIRLHNQQSATSAACSSASSSSSRSFSSSTILYFTGLPLGSYLTTSDQPALPGTSE